MMACPPPLGDADAAGDQSAQARNADDVITGVGVAVLAGPGEHEQGLQFAENAV